MTKRDLLKDCISIAHDTGKFGDYVFVCISTQIKSVNFRIHLDGWELEEDAADINISIYEKQGYKDYESGLKYNCGIDTVESLHKYLTNFYNDLKVYHEAGK